ncbi:MAG: Pr6Pr family membrane protein [Pseudomonadota bacterium]
MTPALTRPIAALLSLAAVGTLALQTYVDVAAGTALGTSIWDQALFFTNITVLMVALICGWTAVRGWPGASWPAGLVLWIVLTGVVYHALLARTHNPEGLDVLVNIFQHTVLPIGVALAWLLLAPKAGLSLRDPMLWACYPIVYAAYGLIRGLTGPRFPYFFLDPVKSGWVGVAAYSFGLAMLFFVMGLVVLWIARRTA